MAASPGGDGNVWIAIATALGALGGIYFKGFFDTRKSESAGQTSETLKLIEALLQTSERQEAANGRASAQQDRLIEKLLHDQAHFANRIDTMGTDLKASEAAHHKCELTCSDLMGRLALLERGRSVSP